MFNKEQIRADETKFVQRKNNTWDPYHFGLKSVFARLDVLYEDQVKRWTACASFREKSRRESPFFAVLVLVSSYVHYHDREYQETDIIHPRDQSWCLPCFQCSFDTVDRLPVLKRQVEGDEQPPILCGCRHRLSVDPWLTSAFPMLEFRNARFCFDSSDLVRSTTWQTDSEETMSSTNYLFTLWNSTCHSRLGVELGSVSTIPN